MSVKSSIRILRTIEFDPDLKIGKIGPGTARFFALKKFIQENELDIPQPTQEFCIRGWNNLSAPGTPGYKAPQSTWSKHNPTDYDANVILTLKWVAMAANLEIDHSTPWSKSGSCHWSNIRLIPKAINRFMSNDATLTNSEVNEFIGCMSPNIREKGNIPHWFQLTENNGLSFLKTLKFEYFLPQSV